MKETHLLFDEGEVPNNLNYDQALKLGLVPFINADGQEDYFADTGTSVRSFEVASKQIAQLLSGA